MGAVCCPCCYDDVAPAPDDHQSADQEKASRYSSIDPFQSINVSPENPLKLIDGYLEEPLLSLPEALQPVQDQIPHLSEHIREALIKRKFPNKHKLTEDESAAIYLYSMKWGPPCLADQLQAAWNSGDRAQLKPWFKYLRLFKSAYDKLPNAPGKFYQGTAKNAKLQKTFEKDGLALYCSFGACLESKAELKSHLRQQGQKDLLVVGYEAFDGKSIAEYTVDGAKVVLIFPSSKCGKVTLEERFKDGSVVMHLVAKTSE